MKAYLPHLALLGASLFFMALVGEIVLRVLVGPPIIWRHPQERYERDAEMGHRLAPNQVSFTHDKLFETNSQGIRAPEVPRQRRTGARRLLSIGDSQTAGDGLPLEHTWPAQLAHRLASISPDTSWEVLNAGLSGTSPWQYVIQFERMTAVYEFDGVVIGLYVNDVTPRPDRIEGMVVTNTLTRRVGYLLKRGALATAIWRARLPLAAALRPDKNTNRETRIISGEYDPLIERGWRDLEKSLRQIRDSASKHKMDIWLLIIPRRDQVDGSEIGRAYNERSTEIAERLSIPVVDVLEPMIVEYKTVGRELFIAWDGHNSSLANGIIARELAAVIMPNE